ncbi:MAG: LPS-assembly protein LptD, partial [Phenylobacterium sp.]
MLAGVALAVLAAGGAWAQAPVATETTSGPDGLKRGELYMEADEVVRNDDTGVTTAKGDIEVRYNGRTLRADGLTYDDRSGVIRAQGNVVILGDDGSIEYAREIVLDEDMRAGVALGFSARLQENVKIAAASVSRRNEKVDELTQAIYTPC